MKLKLLALLSICVINICHGGYIHEFRNATPYSGWFNAVYNTCEDVQFYLPAGKSKIIGKGLCILERVDGYVDVPQFSASGRTENRTVQVYEQYAGPYTGSSTYVMYGPVNNQYFIGRVEGSVK